MLHKIYKITQGITRFWYNIKLKYNQFTTVKYLKYKKVFFNPCRIRVNGKSRIIICPNTTIKIGDYFTCNSGDMMTFGKTKIVVYEGARLTIGENSGCTNLLLYCANSITIGNYVNIGSGCTIMDTNFHSSDWKLRRKDSIIDQKDARTAPIIIKDDVFIGAYSIIMKGVTIGERSMISAGSVVCSNIPADEIWGGNPAKFIKRIK